MGRKEVGAVVGHSLRTEEPEVQREGKGQGAEGKMKKPEEVDRKRAG